MKIIFQYSHLRFSIDAAFFIFNKTHFFKRKFGVHQSIVTLPVGMDTLADAVVFYSSRRSGESVKMSAFRSYRLGESWLNVTVQGKQLS